MTSFKKLAYLADKFEHKYAQDVSTNQVKDTDTLFFGVGNDFTTFTTNILSDSGSFKKYLLDLATQTQKSVSVTMSMNAVPKKGAQWNINIQPPTAKNAILSKLNEEFQKVRKMPLTAAQTQADQGAKAGGGSGAKEVFNINIDM